MLKDSFYHITASSHQENTIIIPLNFNAGHPIFAGHFPGQPVVPGACMLQMVKEVLNDTLSADYRLRKADNLKFIAPVDPRIADEVELKIAYKSVEAGLQVNASLIVDGVVCFKMQGVFMIV